MSILIYLLDMGKWSVQGEDAMKEKGELSSLQMTVEEGFNIDTWNR